MINKSQKLKNLYLPGNLRYQPKSLIEFFGYDNLYSYIGRVEIACLEVLGEIGVMPAEIFSTLTAEVKERILKLPTTDIDYIERTITKHDIRAWIKAAEEVVPTVLKPWLHIILTSFDAIDTARILQYSEAHWKVVEPSMRKIMLLFVELIKEHHNTLQIGRTHGQHALPITAGFWFATILSRLFNNYLRMNQRADALTAKISGAVGSYNAQQGLGILEACGFRDFEGRILRKLNLKTAPISTQILAPEPLSDYLFAMTMTSASFAQFGRDARHLMRSEIGEIAEEFSTNQAGSSTMAHKRNPINFENLEGMYIRTENEFGKVLDTMISEHQRDLVGSSVARDFPIIVVNFVTQMDTLLRPNLAGKPFLQNITINKEACLRNFNMSKNVILSELLYIAMQMIGIQNAHHIVNHSLVPKAQASGKSLIEVADEYAQQDLNFKLIWESRFPDKTREMINHPELYTGLASKKALEIAEKVIATLGE